MQIKCRRASKNEASSRSNQNISLFIEKKILEAEQKPSAPALQLILGKYLEHVSYSFLSFYFPSESTNVQINWLFGHDF